MAVAVFFFINGAVFGNWVPRIPEVQQNLGLDNAQLGIALLGMTAGNFAAMPVAGWVTGRLGSRRSTMWSAVVYSLAVALPPASVNIATLAGGLAVLGASNAVLDVAMNAQGVAAECRTGRSALPYFHAAFSVGSLAGAGSGAAFAAARVPPVIHLVAVGAASAALALLASPALLPGTSQAQNGSRMLIHPTRALIILGAIGFCALLAEGSVADWSAVYLKRNLAAGPGLAGAGYVAFEFTMVLGRLSGVSLTRLLGPSALVRSGGALLVAATIMVVLPGHIDIAIAGFACLGIAISCIFPLVVSATGQTQEVPAGAAIATVSMMAYTGFVAGPPMIGFIAQAFTLRAGLAIVGALGAVIFALGHAVKPAVGSTDAKGDDDAE